MLKAGRPSKSVKEKTIADIQNKSVIRVNFDLDEDLHTKLKLFAIQNKKTIKEVLTEQISEILK